MEEWRIVNGFENYEISSLGRLKVNLKYRKYRDYNSRILNPSKDNDGYYRTILTKNDGSRISKRISRLVAENFLINSNNYPVVNHINGIKDDNRVENLEWCTVRENNIHALRTGLKIPPSREKHHMSKLKECDIIDIRNNNDNLHQWQLALIYNISQTQISRIQRKIQWNYE